jgi:carbon monoxide dehydrogenase subunit G
MRAYVLQGKGQPAWTEVPIVARRQIAVSPEEVLRFLDDLENHAGLAPGSVEVLSLDRGKDATAHAVVRLRGPLGIRRTARTELLPMQRGSASIEGRAMIGNRTTASIVWTIQACGQGRSDVTLCARVEQAAPLDRLLLRLGAGRWLGGHFATALAHLSDDLVAATDWSEVDSIPSRSSVGGLTERAA